MKSIKIGQTIIAQAEDKTDIMPLFKREKGGQQSAADLSLEVWAKGKFSPFHIGDVVHSKSGKGESFTITMHNKGKGFADGKTFSSMPEVKAYFKKNWPAWFKANKDSFPQFRTV